MKECKSITRRMLRELGNLFKWCLKKIIRFWLRVERKVIKRYLNLETPIYKWWWKNHVVCMQKKLDETRKNAEYGNF